MVAGVNITGPSITRSLQISVTLWDGKTLYRLGKTEPEAWLEWFARVEIDHDVSDVCPSLRQTVDRYIAEVLPRKSAATQRNYLAALRMLRPVFGRMPISALKPRHVYAYMDKRPHVIANREKATLSAVVTECVRWGAVDRNLVREVRRNPEKPRDRYVEDEDVLAFLQHCSPFLKAYVDLKTLTGLRQGQLLSLEASCWDGEVLHLWCRQRRAGIE